VPDIVGYCVSTIPLRYSKDISFASIVRNVHEDLLSSSQNQFLGLNEIINGASLISSDVLNVLLTIENLPGLFLANKHNEFLGENLRGFTMDYD